MKNVFLICDLQYGSTGKGLIAGYLAKYRLKPDTVVTAWAPNAGHTFIDSDGRKFVHRMLANGIVSPNIRNVLIGPGSAVDLDVLYTEITSCEDLLQSVNILMHEHAAIVSKAHRDKEDGTMTKIGSTKKGTGAAVIQKIERDPDNMNVAKAMYDKFPHPVWDKVRVVTRQEYAEVLDSSSRILVEGAQGFSLGMNSGFYPYTTSRECTPGQIMVDCAIPHDRLFKVIGTMRTFPIRVANRYDSEGRQIGWSGPCYDDQREMQWSELGIEPELTTVTKLPRRVFTFSEQQTVEAMRACRPDVVFLNFVNYLKTPEEVSYMSHLINLLAGKPVVKWHGHGPSVSDIRPQALSPVPPFVDAVEGGKPYGEEAVLW